MYFLKTYERTTVFPIQIEALKLLEYYNYYCELIKSSDCKKTYFSYEKFTNVIFEFKGLKNLKVWEMIKDELQNNKIMLDCYKKNENRGRNLCL